LRSHGGVLFAHGHVENQDEIMVIPANYVK